MNHKRLEHLIKTMYKVAERDAQQKHKHFDIAEWACNVSERGEAKCGTVACALGWEATTRYAHTRGLELRVLHTMVLDRSAEVIYEDEDGRLVGGMSAAASYFDIEFDTACLLFDCAYTSDERDTTPMNVIDRVSYLLKVGEKHFLGIARWLEDEIGSGDLEYFLPGGEDYKKKAFMKHVARYLKSLDESELYADPDRPYLNVERLHDLP